MDSEDFALHVGEELRAMREGSGLTVGELAKEARFSTVTIYSWEAGRTAITMSNFMTLCLTLGDHPSDVLRRIEQHMLLDY